MKEGVDQSLSNLKLIFEINFSYFTIHDLDLYKKSTKDAADTFGTENVYKCKLTNAIDRYTNTNANLDKYKT